MYISLHFVEYSAAAAVKPQIFEKQTDVTDRCEIRHWKLHPGN